MVSLRHWDCPARQRCGAGAGRRAAVTAVGGITVRSVALRPPNLLDLYLRGPLAQLVEHLTFNQGVTGSRPVRPTKHAFCYTNLLLLSYVIFQRYAAAYSARFEVFRWKNL